MIKPALHGARATAMLTAGALFLAGCGAATNGTSNSGPPAEGGTLVVTTAQGAIPQLDPGLATFQWERVLYPLLWNGLTEVKENDEVVPGLAESWTPSDDLKTWTFTLRDGVTFTNGRPLKPKDIVWNIERVIDPANSSIAHRYLIAVKKAEASGKNQVTVTLTEPDITLPLAISALRIIAPESVDSINQTPVGTGPFEMKDFVPNQSLELQANDDYWGTKPHLEEIHFVAAQDASAAVTALRTGDIQVLWNLATADAKPLEQDPSVALLQSEQSTQFHWLSVDNSSPPFNDPKARQALAYSLDREGTKQIAYSGFGEPAIYNEPVPLESWAFDSDGLTDYSTDLDMAAKLFAEAGVSEGDTLTWWGIAGSYPEWNKEAQLLQQNLAKIGITLKIENNEIGTWVNKFIPTGKKYPGLIVPNAGGDLSDPSFAYDSIGVVSCECNYSSKEMTGLAARAQAMESQDERASAYLDMLKLNSTDVPKVFSMHAPLITATRSNVTGLWQSPSGDLHLETAALENSP